MSTFKRFLRSKKEFDFFFDYYSYIWYKYHSLFFGKLIFKGLKIKAFNNFGAIKNRIKKEEKADVYLSFIVAMLRITPSIFLKPLRRRSEKGIPVPIGENKKFSMALKWLFKLSKRSKNKLSYVHLSNLMVMAIYNKGAVIDKKKDLYRTASLSRHLLKYFR